MANTKICIKCKEEWFLEMFVKDETAEDGLRPLCKFCDPVFNKTEKVEDPEIVKWYAEQGRKTPRAILYDRYKGIKRRCNDPKCPEFKFYGGRGIECHFETFEEFYDHVEFDLMIDPHGLQIHRMDNDGHYERGNIEFLTSDEHSIRHHRRAGELYEGGCA